MKKEELKHILDNLPAHPGVYLMKDHRGKVVYVGKAKSLRSRVRQYFAAGTTDTRHFIEGLDRKLSAIEVVLTSTEKEALLLEHTLIQKHEPRYNVRLTDDKRFLCIRLDLAADWPKLELIRRPKRDGALYFGPYDSAHSARSTLRLINKHFRLRSCSDRAFASRSRPCLQHQIKRCYGPCTLDVDRDEYLAQARDVEMFLEGRMDELVDRLKEKMERASRDLEYERAAAYRDQVAAVERTLAPQRVADFKDIDQDVVGLARDADLVQVSVLEVVRGRLNGKVDYFFKGVEIPDEEFLSSFIVQRYEGMARIPDEVIVSRPIPDAEILSEVLSERRGMKVRAINPRRGPRVEQARMADVNAGASLASRRRDADDVERKIEAVQRKLKLSVPPRRIECVDIAHLGGADTVGGIGVVVEGAVVRSEGKRYRLKVVEGGDDYRAIAEVLERRMRRALAGEDGWEAPDLMVIDGGRGQLAMAQKVLEELGVDDQPVVALAKERGDNGEAVVDRVFLPGRKNPIHLRPQTAPLQLLAAARDEAHRLANRYQGKVRRKKTLSSALDAVPGVGPKLRRRLLKEIGSVERIRAACVEEIAAVKGVGLGLAERIKAAFGE